MAYLFENEEPEAQRGAASTTDLKRPVPQILIQVGRELQMHLSGVLLQLPLVRRYFFAAAATTSAVAAAAAARCHPACHRPRQHRDRNVAVSMLLLVSVSKRADALNRIPAVTLVLRQISCCTHIPYGSQDLTPSKARDAFDLFTADGRVAPDKGWYRHFGVWSRRNGLRVGVRL